MPKAGELSFRCNICGSACTALVTELAREQSSCTQCRSTVRWRSIIHALSVGLFGESIALPDFPERRDISGLGMSDWGGYAVPLAQKLDYTNTYYHQEPLLDITAIEPSFEGRYDFVITSDVFEHVPPPVSNAFTNLYKILKPGGLVVFTVPYSQAGETKEHFPDLHDYELIKSNGRYLLNNTTRSGERQVFEDLIFHGGPGSTLEMREFSETSLFTEFGNAGFKNVKIWKQPDFVHGIYWSVDWSLPIVARKP